MIIELFGPPGVGKTTFATALTASLRERGYVVQPMMSFRPAERAPQAAIAAARRVVRPAIEMLSAAHRLFAPSHELRSASGLVRLLPPRSILWSIRLRQYLTRLFRAWDEAASAGHIVLFDQAFVQAVGSLALLGRAPEWRLVELALDSVPRSDLLIRLDAAPYVLEARLSERERRQSRIERLFELDLPTNLEFVRIIDRLHALLRQRDRPVLCVGSSDPQSLGDAVARAEAHIMARLGAEQAVMA